MKSELLAIVMTMRSLTMTRMTMTPKKQKTRRVTESEKMPKKSEKRAAQEGEDNRGSSTHVFNPDTPCLAHGRDWDENPPRGCEET